MIVPEYVPGQWNAVVAGGVVALLAPTTAPDVVRAVWDAVPANGGLADQLEVLLRGGIAGLQPFALVDVTGGRVHAALRGDVEVEVSGSDGVRVLAPGEVTTWSERVAEGADVMTVRVAGLASGWDVAAAMPVAAGVVRADGVRVALAALQDMDLPAAPAVVLVDDVLPVVTTLPDEVPVAADEHVLPDDALQPDDALLPDDTLLPDDALLDEVVPLGAVDDAAPLDVDAAFGRQVEDLASAEPVADEPGSGALIEGAPAWLVEPTVAPGRTVPELFDVPAVPEPALSSGPVVLDGTAYPDHAGLPAPVGLEPEPDVVAEAEAVLGAGTWGTPEVDEQPAGDDHDGLTILSSDLVAIRDQLPSWAGDEVPGPFRVVAPDPVPEVRLVLSTGTVVPLDRSVLLGRAPQVLRVTNRDLPRLVSVPSPQQDISRTHAEVRAEGGDVLVTDLESTNGVLVSRPGERARRLHPGEATVVQLGELVDLGDGVTFTVERGT